MIVRTPAPSSPTRRAQAPSNSISEEAFERLPSLSLSRCRRKRLSSPSGRPPRHQEAGDAAVGLAEDEERVALRGGEEPLVAGELVLSAGTAAVDRPPDGGVGAHVGAALLLGHPHAEQGALLLARRDLARVVDVGEDARLPLLGQLRLLAERRNDRVGHRDRAADARFGLGEAHEGRCAGDVGAGLRLAPGEGVELVRDAEPHQLVPGGVELGLVDPVAVAVVGAELRRVLVGEPPELDHVGAAGDLADRRDLLDGPVGALPADCLTHHRVGGEDVVVGQRRGLVGDLVGTDSGWPLNG